MRLVVLTYRLTKIKGVLVSVGVCALTNATMFIGSLAVSAGLALGFSNAAQAGPSPTPGCNGPSPDGTITSSSGTALSWSTAPSCTVAGGATVAMTNATALVASGYNSHNTLTNNGYVHSSLTGTALNNATIAGFNNLVNVGSIANVVDATITGDYQPETIAATIGTIGSVVLGLSGPGNTFAIYGVNNQSVGSIASFQNDGVIQATFGYDVSPDTVSQGILVGVNNAGSIGSLTNTGQISANINVYGPSNNLTVVGLANSSTIGTLSNSGLITGDIGLVNGSISGFGGPSLLQQSSASIGQLTNSGEIVGNYLGLATEGNIGTLTNSSSGLILGGYAGLYVAPSATIGLLDNQAGAAIQTYDGFVALMSLGSITTLHNGGYIGTGGEGNAPVAIFNGGTIDALNNDGVIAGNVSGILNVGGTIGSLANTGQITGGGVGLANEYGSYYSSIGTDGSIGTLTNSGLISGSYSGIVNQDLIGTLLNTADTITSGTISGDAYGIYNGGSIGTLNNGFGAAIIAYTGTAVQNQNVIDAITNDGLIQGQTGIENLGLINSLSNTLNGVISGESGVGVYNDGLINTFNNDGLITAANNYDGVVNDVNGTIGSLTNSATGTITSSATYYNGTAVYNAGVIGTLTNNGVIAADNWWGAGINQQGSIGTLMNGGLISGGEFGVLNTGGEGGPGVISVLENSGVITGGYAGIANDGVIGAMTNTGLIQGWVGLTNDGSIGSIANLNVDSGTGTISGNVTGIYNSGQIDSLSNDGVISGGSTGIKNYGVIGQLTNTGAITGGSTDGIYNNGVIGSLANSGVISGGDTGIYNDGSGTVVGSIGTLVNAQGGTISGWTAIYNSGEIGSLTNSGVIAGDGEGVYNDGGSIGTLWNTSTGTITAEYAVDNYGVISTLVNDGKIIGGRSGVYNDSNATIGSLSNSGVISGGTTGVYNEGSIGALSNTGLILGGTNVDNGTIGDSYGIYNDGTIDSIYNDGSISGAAVNGSVSSFGIYNEYNIGTIGNDRHGTISGFTAIVNWGSIGTLMNAGAILGSYIAIDNEGSIGSLSNLGDSGLIEADYAIVNDVEGTIDSLTNSGIISGRTTGIDNFGTISSLVNSGQITGGSAGLYNDNLITSLVNQGMISGDSIGVANSWGGSIGTLTNSGTITATGASGVALWNAGEIGALTNTGLISGVSAGVRNDQGSIGTLANSGTIEATGTIGNGVYNSGSIVSLTNGGLISGGAVGIYNDASAPEPSVTLNVRPLSLPQSGAIDSLSNSSTGTISGGATGIYNAGLIGTLSNAGLITGTAGDGLYTDGSIGSMTNDGVISGALHAVNIDGSGAVGSLVNSGRISAPTAISVAADASLGAVTNSGIIAGDIVNASANDLSIAGGSGSVFGTLTGYSGGVAAADIGMISNTASNLSFRSGNVLLNDNLDVGTGTVTNAANLQVNNPLSVTGNYLQTAAGALAVGVAGLNEHGELNVSSTAVVDPSGQVALTRLQGFRFAAGEQFTLIDAASGTYNVGSMVASASGFDGGYLINQVTVDGHTDLVVCLTNRVTPNCSGVTPAYSVATTSNAVSANNAAGRYAGSDVGLNNLANAVVALTSTAQANRAGNQLLAEPHQNAVALAAEPALDVLNVVTGHTDGTRLAANGEQTGVSAGESGKGFATWGEGFGGGSHQSQDGQFSGYSMSSEGLVAGADTAVGESNVRVGGVFTYAHGDLKDHGDRTGDTLSLNSYGLLGYGSVLGARAYADLIGGVLFDKFDTVRVIDFTGFNGVASGSHNGTQYVLKAAGGYRFPMGDAARTTLTPVWGLAYSRLNQDAYTESGGNGAALRVGSDGSNSLKSEVGMKVERSFPMSRGDLVPEVKVLYRHEFDDGAQFQTASFAADQSASTFTTENLRPIVNSGVLSAGVNLLGKDGLTVTLKYSAEVGSGYVSQGGSLRVRWAF